MRTTTAVLAAVLAYGGAVAAPADAWLPSVCNAVAMESGSSALVAYDARGGARAARAATAAGGLVVGGIPALNVLQVSFGSPVARDAALPLVARAPGVRGVQAESVARAHKAPNDPLLRYQWGLAKIGAPRAWDRETGATAAVTVAVLDSGIDLAHPDLAGRLVPGRDVVNDDLDPMDDHGHGTVVAGIVGARTHNKAGVAGTSWGARLLPVKVLDETGGGSDCDIAYGMVWAADAGADVLNLSLGSDGVRCGIVTQYAVDYARSAGAVVVAAAGNAGANGNPTSSPANCSGVLAVGATDQRDKVASFSTHHAYVDVSAPGVGVVSTAFDPRQGRRYYAAFHGTSMSAAFVSGLAALLLARNPSWTPDQVAARIVATADDRGPRGTDDYFGAGRINAARALA
ncbi:MAG TPA: S8 family serine peptidase [Frankiaceae bacterium]|nr:S8 family serine peptidase [Frankiaceae bacterium]